jgi:general nucleoside transport system ATP-binding protein
VALTTPETATLFAALKVLAADGVSAVFSTRRPDEALAGADRVVVLRAGRKVADVAARDSDAGTLSTLVAGRAIATLPSTPHAPGNAVLELSLIDVPGPAENLALHQVSLVVRAGEIIGVAGTPHNVGRTCWPP